jgi:hypothetical protein
MDAGAVVQIFNGRAGHLAQSGKIKCVNLRPGVGNLFRPTVRCGVASGVNMPENPNSLAFK